LNYQNNYLGHSSIIRYCKKFYSIFSIYLFFMKNYFLQTLCQLHIELLVCILLSFVQRRKNVLFRCYSLLAYRNFLGFLLFPFAILSLFTTTIFAALLYTSARLIRLILNTDINATTQQFPIVKLIAIIFQ